jgi:hypothetical protein
VSLEPGVLDILRDVRRSASDRRKVFLALYGLFAFAPLALGVVALGRAGLLGGVGDQLDATFRRPVQSTVAFFREAALAGRWGLLAATLLGIWFVGALVGSFFGLAVTRMAAVELTCRRRSEAKEALRFAARNWFWVLLTPVSLLAGAVALLGAAVLVLRLPALFEPLLVVAGPLALLLCVGAGFLLVGLLAGGFLASPCIATEWSDSFDAISRVYGYGFGHAHRLLLYRCGGALMMLCATLARAARVGLALVLFYAALVAGLGAERATSLLHGIFLEPPQGLLIPPSAGGWAVLLAVAALLTALLARLLVLRVVLLQAIYLRLRFRVDKVPMENIDGYRPDDSAYDPVAQGFELVEVEEEIQAE